MWTRTPRNEDIILQYYSFYALVKVLNEFLPQQVIHPLQGGNINVIPSLLKPASCTHAPSFALKHYLDPAEELCVKQVRHSVTTQGLLGTWFLLTCGCDYEEVMFPWWCWAGTSRWAGQGGMGWQVVGKMRKAWDHPTTLRMKTSQQCHFYVSHCADTHSPRRISQLDQSLSSNCHISRWWEMILSLCSWQAWVSVLWVCICMSATACLCARACVWRKNSSGLTGGWFAALAAWRGCCMRSTVSKSRLSERRHDHVDLMDSWWLVLGHLWTANWITTAAKHDTGLQSAIISLMGYSLVFFNWKTIYSLC